MMKKLFILIAILTVNTMCYGQSFEDGMKRANLVNIEDVDCTIGVDLRYSTTNNFMGMDAYGDLEAAYLLPEMARRLAVAQKVLLDKGYCLKVLDAARPISVQRAMWDIVKGTKDSIYVAKPTRGGMHNFGAAVDVTIYDVTTGAECEMGSPFDWFGSEAWTNSKTATPERELLIKTMQDAGFKVYDKEWWHYEMAEFSSKDIRAQFQLLNF